MRREEGGPTSKTTLSEEHGRRSTAKRHQERPMVTSAQSVQQHQTELEMNKKELADTLWGGELRRIGTQSVERVSDRVIKGLLDDRRQQKVFSTWIKDSVMEGRTSGSLSTVSQSPAQWSDQAFILLTSEEELDVFDLKKYSASEKGLLRLLPVVKASRTSLVEHGGVGRLKPALYKDSPSKVESSSSGMSLNKDIASMYLMDRDDDEGMHFKSHCEKCKAALQSPDFEKVTPRRMSKWSFEVQLEGKGTYECSATGLVFEVSDQAVVRYSVLSWFQFSEFLKDSWRPAGSIYDVVVVNKDPSVLKFIHFPHSLCLAEPEHEQSFSVLHVKKRHADIESTVDFTASHVKWRVSLLCPVGVIIPSSQPVEHQPAPKPEPKPPANHGLVLVYKELGRKKYLVFLSLNTLSEIKAIEEQVLISRKNGIKITETFKHLTCRLEEKLYCLKSDPEGQFEPLNLEFTTAVLALKGLFVARFGNLPPFKLFLKDTDCDQPFLNVTIREDDWPSEERPALWNSILRFLIRFFYNGYIVCSGMTVPATFSPPATSSATQPVAKELLRIRLEFVNRASDPLIKGLLDELLHHEVLNSEEMDCVMDQSGRADRARKLIDMVRRKGERASQKMIDCMKDRDSHFSSTLGLIYSPTG